MIPVGYYRLMSRPPPPEPTLRKNVTLPVTMWQEIADYRFTERIGSEAEAVRRLLVAALRTLGQTPVEGMGGRRRTHVSTKRSEPKL